MILEGCQGKPRTPEILEKVCPQCGSETAANHTLPRRAQRPEASAERKPSGRKAQRPCRVSEEDVK